MSNKNLHRTRISYSIKRIFFGVLYGIFALVLVFNSLLQTDMVQNYIAKKASEMLTQTLGVDVHIEKLHLSLMMDLTLEGVLMKDLHQNDMIVADYLNFSIEGVDLSNLKFSISKLRLENSGFVLRKYKGEPKYNISMVFPSDSTDTTAFVFPATILCGNAALHNCFFQLINETKPKRSGFDHNNIVLAINDLQSNSIHISDEEYSFKIKKLQVSDVSGFTVENLSTYMKFLPDGWYMDDLELKTPTSDLKMNLIFAYSTFDNIGDFVDSIRIISDIQPSTLDVKDIAYFASSLSKYPITAQIEGKVDGFVNDLNINDFNISIADNTKLSTTTYLKGIINPETAYMKVDISDFQTTIEDINALKSMFGEFSIPSGIVDRVSLTADFTGTLDNFDATAKVDATCGSARTHVRMWKDLEFGDYQYYGILSASNLHTVESLGLNDIYKADNIFINFDGFGTTLDNAKMQVNGELCGIYALGYNYDTLNINGNISSKMFHGDIKLNDKNAGLDFNGLVNFNDTIPVFDFSVSIRDAYLARLGFLPERSDDSHISANISMKVKGDDVDEMIGFVNIDDVVLVENDSIYDFRDFRIGTYQQMSGDRKIILRSEVLDANFEGNFQFDEIAKIYNYYIESYFSPNNSATDTTSYVDDYNVLWNVSLKDVSPVTRLFVPKLKIPTGLYLNGELDVKNKMFFTNGQSPKIVYNNMFVKNWYFTNNTKDSMLQLRTGFDQLVLDEPDENDSVGIIRNHVDLNAFMQRDTVNFKISWDNLTGAVDSSHYFVQGLVDLVKYPETKFSITDIQAMFNNHLWEVSADNHVIIDSNTNILIHDLKFYSDTGFLSVDGNIYKDSMMVSDVNLNLSNIDLSFLNLFLQNINYTFNGMLSGSATVKSGNHQFFFLSDLSLNALNINGKDFGNTVIKSEWHPEKEGAYLDVESSITSRRGKVTHPLQVKGYFYPESKTQNFDIQCNLNKIQLSILNPLIDEFVEKALGFVSGSATLQGTYKKPKVVASIEMANCEALIKYTNVKYSFTGSIDIDEKMINFHNLILTDTLNGNATIQGGIKHNNFSDFELDLTLNPDKFIFLNTNRMQNDIFYGDAVVNGKVQVTGPINDINISAFVKTNQGTNIAIPISSAMSIDETTYVIFQNKDYDSLNINKMKSSVMGLTLTLRMMMTPEGQIRVFLPGNIGNLSANGNGIITLKIDKSGNMSLGGAYTLEGGKFILNLQNIFSKTFEINKGSTITFDGDPMDAILNVSATYGTKTTLNGLNLALDSTVLQQRTNVNCIIKMTDELSNPQLGFTIQFPNLSEDITSLIYTVMDTTNEVVMTQQAFSLLAVNTFSLSSSESSLGGTMASSGINVVTNRINGWLSQISKDVDIGINYRPGEHFSADEVGVALSTQLFKNRVTIDANVGYSGNSNSSGRASSVVGDVTVEVKITKDGRFTTKVFSRSNANDISKIGTSSEQGYTYGIGVNYHKNFDKFKEIFIRTPEQKRLNEQKKAERKNKKEEKRSVEPD